MSVCAIKRRSWIYSVHVSFCCHYTVGAKRNHCTSCNSWLYQATVCFNLNLDHFLPETCNMCIICTLGSFVTYMVSGQKLSTWVPEASQCEPIIPILCLHVNIRHDTSQTVRHNQEMQITHLCPEIMCVQINRDTDIKQFMRKFDILAHTSSPFSPVKYCSRHTFESVLFRLLWWGAQIST